MLFITHPYFKDNSPGQCWCISYIRNCMKKINLLLLLLCLSPLISFAQQAKYAPLGEKDKLIGEWEWISNDTGAPCAPVPDQDWRYFRFAAGTNMSMAALTYEEAKGYGCPTYFLAFSNGNTITGTISDTCTPSDKGKKFSFAYEYDPSSDQLTITVRGEKFHYKRRH